VNYVVERVSNADRARYALGASPNAHQGKTQTIPMFQESRSMSWAKKLAPRKPQKRFSRLRAGGSTPRKWLP
jgi:hypothetical protein